MIQLVLEKQIMLLRKQGVELALNTIRNSNLILNLCENGDFHYDVLGKDYIRKK